MSSSSTSSYSSMSYNTLLNTTTSYKNLPSKLDGQCQVGSTPTTATTSSASSGSSPIKSVKFASEPKYQIDEEESENDSNQSATTQFTSNSSHELSDFASTEMLKIKKHSQEEVNNSQAMNLSPNESNSCMNMLAYSSYSSYFSKEDRKSPKPIWKSDPKNLIRSSCNFVVQVRLLS